MIRNKSLAYSGETLLYDNYELLWSEDPYNPFNLPAGTIRVRTSDGQPPSKGSHTSYETATLMPGTSDVYDVYKSGTSMNDVLYNSDNVVEIIGANTSNITDMHGMFQSCSSLTTVALFDTSSVTDMSGMFSYCSLLTSVPLFNTSSVTNMHDMFYECYCLTTVPLFNTSSVTDMSRMFYRCNRSLTSVPLFDTSSVTDMYGMFYKCTSLTSVLLFNTSNVTIMTDMFHSCYNVQSGALALYQQAYTQANPPSFHQSTFYNCGRDTTTGAAELAQIPWGWKQGS